MQVIEVIPLSRGSQIESLSYYSAHTYPIGTLIDVPIRKQTKRAVVVKCSPVSMTKTAVRTATFSLKKLPEQPKLSTLPPILVETAKRLMKTTPATLGSILFALLPPEVRDGEVDLESNLPCIGTYETPAVTMLQGTFEERLRTYRSYVREHFAHRGSVLLTVPTSADVDRLNEALAVGIENRVVTFSSTHTKKKLATSYHELADLSHAKLIIATPTYSCIDRHDITAIIIEECRSVYYTAKTRPYLDTRKVLSTIAQVSARQVLMGDVLPRSEEEYLRREDFYNTEGETPKRLTLPSNLHLIQQLPDQSASEQFTLISKELASALLDTAKRRQRSFILAARRGIAPLVSCVDCGHIFRCPDSGEPYSLYRTGSGENEKRWFIAASSGRRLRAPDTCTACGSWRLRERGIGIQHLHAVIKQEFPKIPLILFDHTTATTKRRAQQLISSFYETKNALLLGTAMVLPYLEKPVATIAVPSLEALRATPTWRAEESYFALLLQLRERATERVYVQSRSEKDEIFTLAEQGLVEQFYDGELELRQQLSYPPYAYFVHITLQGAPEVIAAQESEIAAQLQEYKIQFYTAPQFITNGIRRYGLLRVPRTKWPDETLMEQLRQLPPSARIEINPERIV